MPSPLEPATDTPGGWELPDADVDDVVAPALAHGTHASDPLIGRVLAGRYRVESLLGKGAMGAVYRAKHIKVGRMFAIKVLHERLLVDPKTHKRFEREANLAGKLHHPNVVGVIDVGETDDGIHFMVMEYAEGTTLGSLVRGPMEPRRVLSIAQQLLDGLQHAHETGLIHRDFKPENVIVEVDRFGVERPRIVDFGIAILRDEARDPAQPDRLTTAGLVLGTPHYMAPEHATGGGIDHRIDLFALGVILYELITGAMPYDGDGVDVARANLTHPTPPMGVRVPGIVVDPLLEAFTRLLMQKDPSDRPESAKAARHLLDMIEKDRAMAARVLGVTLPATAEPPPIALPRSSAPVPPEPSVPRPRRWPLVAGVGVAMAAVTAIVLVTRSEPSVSAQQVSHAPRITPTAVNAVPASPTPPSTEAPVAAPSPAAPMIPTAPPPAPSAPKQATRAAITKPVARPVPPRAVPRAATVDVPPPIPDDANAVAALYGKVGRDLKALDGKKGADVAQPLWMRFRQIRIQDALTSADKRAATARTLQQLQADIAAASAT